MPMRYSESIMSDTVITVENLWKRYGLPWASFFRKGQHWFRRCISSENRQSNVMPELAEDGPFALKDVSFKVKQGDTLGIIGRNGAGKSTLLKIFAGVTQLTHGRVEVCGRVFPMIELNAGIHTDLTGRENVRMLGAIMGLTRSETEAKMPAVVAFSELGEWFDRPVRMYSSGMLARLGFSVAVNVDANILLIDEVLSVGDLPFQRKCYKHLEKLRHNGATTILVSHNIRQVERLCTEVIFLEQGKIVSRGDSAEICHQYMKAMTNSHFNKKGLDSNQSASEALWEGTGEVRINKVETLHGAGGSSKDFVTYEPILFRIEFKANSPIKDPIVGIGIYTADMLLISAFSNEKASEGTTLEGEGCFECKISHLPMLPGVYSIGVTIKGRDNSVIYKGLHLTEFNIQYSARVKQSHGFIHLEPHWNFAKDNHFDKSIPKR